MTEVFLNFLQVYHSTRRDLRSESLESRLSLRKFSRLLRMLTVSIRPLTVGSASAGRRDVSDSRVRSNVQNVLQQDQQPRGHLGRMCCLRWHDDGRDILYRSRWSGKVLEKASSLDIERQLLGSFRAYGVYIPFVLYVNLERKHGPWI